MPKDLISLTRSNKLFRKILMNKTAIYIWHGVMRNIPGIPPCPPHLSEPHYLALIYTHNCSMCGTTVNRRMDEILYVQLCMSCCTASLVKHDTLPRDVQPLVLSSSTIMPSKRRYVYHPYAPKSDAEVVQTHLDKFKKSGDTAALTQ
ncbi:hypothetical protein FRC12_007693 [Ceratobasidium sp. 428]|nr:hypothetical protein FRC12_007693 [Ceratobasidium sp. 428]